MNGLQHNDAVGAGVQWWRCDGCNTQSPHGIDEHSDARFLPCPSGCRQGRQRRDPETAWHAQRIIDKLAERLEDQTFLEGADRVECPAIVGRFDAAAGRLERYVRDDAPAKHAGAELVSAHVLHVAYRLWKLRRIVAEHAAAVTGGATS